MGSRCSQVCGVILGNARSLLLRRLGSYYVVVVSKCYAEFVVELIDGR
jgi:hypothetical protein